MMIGVLALQGGYGLHAAVVRRLGYAVIEVRDPADLPGLTALILPGGESTVMGLLLERRGLMAPLREALSRGLPVLGTCAGAILLARDIEASDQLRLGVLDMTVARNAYGSQIDSFNTTLAVRGMPGLDRLPGVFIRAPKITQTGPGVAVLSTWGGFPVLVRSGSMVAATFHPELTESVELHRWFLSSVRIRQPSHVN